MARKTKRVIKEWEKSEEEKIECAKKSFYEHFLLSESNDLSNTPEPTYKLEIGEKVWIGALTNPTVHEILHDGRVYIIRYIHTKTRENPEYINYLGCFWTSVRRINDNKDSLVQNDDIILRFENRDINALISEYERGFLDLSPSYQRELVWTINDKISLIDSIFKGIDIGKFVFVNNENILEPNEVLDGKQRIMTLMEFFQDKFTYKGLFFSDLSRSDQRYFKSYHIAWANISPMSYEQKLRYFIMLNTGGKPMAKKHLQKIEREYNQIIKNKE